MKLKKDLLEKVRNGEFIVENDNRLVINKIWKESSGEFRYYVTQTNNKNKFDCTDNIWGSINFTKPIIKASELIEKEDYTKPLEEGELCVFFDGLNAFSFGFYYDYKHNKYPHSDHICRVWKYAFPYEGQTQQGIQEKINNYLKDK